MAGVTKNRSRGWRNCPLCSQTADAKKVLGRCAQ